MNRKIIFGADLAADPSGLYFREKIQSFLASRGYEIEDVGNTSLEQTGGYYKIAAELAGRIQSGEYEQGLLFCGTGMGMSITANKFQGVYAAVVETTFAAKMAKAINRANVLCLGYTLLGVNSAINIIDTWLNTEILEGVNDNRLEPIRKSFAEFTEAEKRWFGNI